MSETRSPDLPRETPTADTYGATTHVAEADDIIVPLTFAQEGLWFLDQLDPGGSAYNVPQVWCLVGQLDVDALRRSLQLVVDRHDALRATFGTTEGRPCQRIRNAAQVGLPVIDVRVQAPLHDAEAMHLAIDEGRRPFDLSQGPLLRACLLRLGVERHWLVIVVHHIVRDGGSMSILRRELSAAYNAFRSCNEPTLAPLPMRYADYIAWQHEQLDGERLQVLLNYWRGRLRDAPAVLNLPTDHRRRQVPTFAGASERFVLDAALVDALRALGREEEATLHMTLLSAFELLLSRYADQDDILVGAPVAGRARPELEGMIGYFANMVVHRGDLRGDPSFRELLRRTRDSAVAAYAHQDMPLGRLVEAIAPQRDRSRNPLFQVIFTLQDAFNLLAGPLPLDGIESTPVDVETGTAKVDLALFLGRTDSGLRGSIEYATDLFEAATIRRMIGSFQTVLSSIIADPDRAVSRLALLDGTERQRIVVHWNATRAPYPALQSLSTLFAQVVVRAPNAIAIVDGERMVTYAELDRRSREAARRLRELGLRPGARVGICIERSIEEIAALLGALKAACVCVPLDPTHPVERLATTLADAGASALVTAGAAVRTLAASAEIRALPAVILDRTDFELFTSAPEPPVAPGGTHLAQIIYTSGSTGSPKGVAITHRAIARLVCGTDYVRLGTDDIVAHVSNPAFDAATSEIFGALLNGATLAVVPRETVLSPRAFATALERHKVTTLFVTTALFNQMARDVPTAFRNCRQVLFGGEAVEPRWVKEVLDKGGPGRLLHVYGPTEATTFATWYEVSELANDASTVPIGRAIANTEVYILDPHGEPVPVGAPGEIHIGGPGVAAGYFGRPDLTAERFVPHRFDGTADARLYRTGDRGRYRDDGAIEFLGRFDGQVKIRGHRIEPGEVEAALLRLPVIREAVVAVHGSSSETRRLTGYVVPAAGAQLSLADIHRELRRSIPGYMVPARIFALAALPLTPNGKIDRRALPDPGEAASARANVPVRPRHPLEHTLASIWEELLGTSDFGVQDAFFDVGGHSLLAAQLVDAIESTCGYRVPLSTLFDHSTIEDLAHVLRRGAVAQGSPVVTLNAAGTRWPFVFLHGDYTGGGFYAHQLARALGPDQPVYAIHPHGLDGAEVPESIESMAEDRVRALRQVRARGPYCLGGYCNGALVAVEMAQQLAQCGEEVPLVVVMDASASWAGEPNEAAESITSAPPSIAPPTASPADAMSDINARYRRVMDAYAPNRYAGHIVVLRSGSAHDTRRSLGWSMISDNVETYDLRGHHHASVTRHIAATAGRIATCLEAARRRHAPIAS